MPPPIHCFRPLVVLEAVARPVRESRHVLGQTREGLEKGGEKELETIVVREKEGGAVVFSRENGGVTWWSMFRPASSSWGRR